MVRHISSLILAVLLFLVLFLSASNFILLSVSVAGLIIVTLAVNLRQLGWNVSQLMLPIFFLLAVASAFSLITGPSLRTIFLTLSCVVFFLVQSRLGKESHFLQNIYLLSAFGIFLGIFGIQFYLNLSIYLLAFLVLVFSYFLIRQGFAGITLPVKKYFSFIIALVCAELALGLSLWPTYFLVNAIVVFCGFYILWLFAVSVFFGKLSVKKISWQLVLIFIVLAVTLASASWKPLVI